MVAYLIWLASVGVYVAAGADVGDCSAVDSGSDVASLAQLRVHSAMLPRRSNAERINVLTVAEQHVQTTTEGCKCKSDCGGDVSTFYKCDWCRTNDSSSGSCRKEGTWGYCDYRSLTVPRFTQTSYSSKLDYYWTNAIANRTRSQYTAFPNFALSMVTSFDNYMPEMPKGRAKMIHNVGSVCKVQLDIRNSSYTGLLGNGVQEGLIRMAPAADAERTGGVVPGVGFKFPRSGVHDGDTVLLYSLPPPASWNFFEKNLSNHVAVIHSFKATLLLTKFKQATQCAVQVGLSDLARYSQDGTEHSPPRFPFKLFMVPNGSLKTGQGAKTIDGVHSEIDAIPKGTTLYTAYACQEPAGDESHPNKDLSSCGKPLLLGDVVTTSECTTSWYGDTQLQVRHQRIEEDWRLEPRYFKQGEYDAEKACENTIDLTAPPVTCGLTGMLKSDMMVE